MENRNEQSGNNHDYNQNNSNNRNSGSNQEQQQQNNQTNKKGNPTYIKDMPEIKPSTRDVGTVSGVD